MVASSLHARLLATLFLAAIAAASPLSARNPQVEAPAALAPRQTACPTFTRYQHIEYVETDIPTITVTDNTLYLGFPGVQTRTLNRTYTHETWAATVTASTSATRTITDQTFTPALTHTTLTTTLPYPWVVARTTTTVTATQAVCTTMPEVWNDGITTMTVDYTECVYVISPVTSTIYVDPVEYYYHTETIFPTGTSTTTRTSWTDYTPATAAPTTPTSVVWFTSLRTDTATATSCLSYVCAPW